MDKHLIDFENMPWVEPGKGLRYKAYKNGNRQVRMVEFSDGFIEADWCTRGHIGYVLEGSCILDFNGKIERIKAGDTFFIEQGENDRHKVILNKGELILVLLVEII